MGRLVAWRYVKPEKLAALEALDTPLFAPDGTGGAPSFRAATQSVLEDEELRPEAFRRHRVPGMILREEPRAMVVHPTELRVGEVERDEINRGRLKLVCTFTLPRGAYATMLIKRLFHEPRPPRPGFPVDNADHARRPARTRDQRWQNER